jgi:CDGSH-type Zn-finger protein
MNAITHFRDRSKEIPYCDRSKEIPYCDRSKEIPYCDRSKEIPYCDRSKRIHKSNRDIQYNDQKGTKGEAMTYKTLHRKLNIE